MLILSFLVSSNIQNEVNILASLYIKFVLGCNGDWATLQEPELGLLLPTQATETCRLLSVGTHGASYYGHNVS